MTPDGLWNSTFCLIGTDGLGISRAIRPSAHQATNASRAKPNARARPLAPDLLDDACRVDIRGAQSGGKQMICLGALHGDSRNTSTNNRSMASPS
jgi:hypothetical protein